MHYEEQALPVTLPGGPVLLFNILFSKVYK